jgi:DNA (cytosine-5)-methyltransferase 1
MAEGKNIGNQVGKGTAPQDFKGGVVDVFCGVGGLSLGFKRAGFRIAAGIDLDEAGRYAFERYTGGSFIKADVAKLDAALVKRWLGKGRPRILIGCAPCQSFSEYNKKSRGAAWNLLPAFARLIEGAQPDIVSMENVARLVDYRGGRTFKTFVNRLSRAGYNVSWFIVSGADYGISQRRKRLILFASKRDFIDLVPPTHRRPVTLRKVIGGLPRLSRGTSDPKDRFHRAQQLSDKNVERLKLTAPGGTWRDWPTKLRVPCHTTDRGKEFGSVYGRLTWDEIGPTITTQFFKLGAGRFGHPGQRRALSLREGGMIQTFPRRFQFVAPSEEIFFHSVGRLIGNAVPVRLGEIIAKSIRLHVDVHFS